MKMMSYGRKRGGQSLVEFAMIAPIFFLLIFGIIDFGRLYFTQSTLQHALREAGRYAVTGNKLSGTNPATTQPYTRVESIKQIASKAAMGLNIGTVTVSSQSGGANSAGGPRDIVTVSLTHTLNLITPIVGKFFNNGQHVFTVTTTFKNEPFNPAQTN